MAAIFAVGQFVEGNILPPKLVGESVGLHPVWLMFALVAFGALFGFVGLLLAVPVAAAIGVLVRFAMERYRASALYRGPRRPPPASAAVTSDARRRQLALDLPHGRPTAATSSCVGAIERPGAAPDRKLAGLARAGGWC